MDNYVLACSKFEEAFGMLKAARMLFYDPMISENERYDKLGKMIDDFIDELTDNY